MIKFFAKLFKKDPCPICGEHMPADVSFVWTLGNGLRMHGGCWPSYIKPVLEILRKP